MDAVVPGRSPDVEDNDRRAALETLGHLYEAQDTLQRLLAEEAARAIYSPDLEAIVHSKRKLGRIIEHAADNVLTFGALALLVAGSGGVLLWLNVLARARRAGPLSSNDLALLALVASFVAFTLIFAVYILRDQGRSAIKRRRAAARHLYLTQLRDQVGESVEALEAWVG